MARTKKTNGVHWEQPFQVRDLLKNCLDDAQPWPPVNNGVYVVSQDSWRGFPKRKARILYVGGNTGKSPRFLTRVGDLIADMLGFWWHSSGGQSLYMYCKENGLHPLDLYLGWAEGVPCSRCAETEVYWALGPPELCKKVPAGCKVHLPPLCACFTLEARVR